jgi:hypothetical protein
MQLIRMGILEFLQHETNRLNRKLLLLTAAYGMANALILAVVNAAVESVGKQGNRPVWRQRHGRKLGYPRAYVDL